QVRPDAGRRHPRRRRAPGRARPGGAAAAVRRLDERRPARLLAQRGDRRAQAPGDLPGLRGAHRRHLLRVEHPSRPAGRARRGRSLGHIDVPEGILVQPRELDDWPDEKLVIISTGSQGEPLSALRRMAHRDHPQVELHQGDTVLFSATPIPGNERAVNETIDRLYHIGCDVITTREAPIHASGHGYEEELKLMLNLVRPRYVMPAHGDHKRIHLHGQLAEAVGVRGDRIFKLENGLPLEIDERGARIGEAERSGMIFVDGVDIGDPTDVALRDRRMLSADGIFIVVATISEQDGSSVAEPEIIFRGVPFPNEAERLLGDIRDTVEASLARAAEEEIRETDLLQKILHDDLAEFVYDRLRRRPMVLPVVVEV